MASIPWMLCMYIPVLMLHTQERLIPMSDEDKDG